MDKIYPQLNEVHKSVELLLLIFLEDDVKKGERATKCKCKADKTHGGVDDEAPDDGNKGGKAIENYKRGDLVSSSIASNKPHN